MDWISVKDRLPEDGSQDHIVFDGNFVFVGEWYAGRWFVSEGDYFTPIKPTHWMPLPQPPKGGSDAE